MHTATYHVESTRPVSSSLKATSQLMYFVSIHPFTDTFFVSYSLYRFSFFPPFSVDPSRIISALLLYVPFVPRVHLCMLFFKLHRVSIFPALWYFISLIHPYPAMQLPLVISSFPSVVSQFPCFSAFPPVISPSLLCNFNIARFSLSARLFAFPYASLVRSARGSPPTRWFRRSHPRSHSTLRDRYGAERLLESSSFTWTLASVCISLRCLLDTRDSSVSRNCAGRWLSVERSAVRFIISVPVILASLVPRSREIRKLL